MATYQDWYSDKFHNEDWRLRQALDEIEAVDAQKASISAKRKSLRKWGRRSLVGTSIETLMTAQGSELAETYVSTNAITTVVSTSASDTQTLKFYEGHTTDGTDATFLFEDNGGDGITLTGTTPVVLPTAAFRANRARLSAAAVGTIAFYEGGTRTNANTHLTIPPGEVQSQKCATCISSSDHWIITGATGSVLEKTGAWAQFRIETKPISGSVFYPATQWIGVTDSSGTRGLIEATDPFLIVPPNYDVRIAVAGNAANVDVAGGIIGVLAQTVA